MSETRMLKCDECGELKERTEWEIPAGWMHLSAWYHPEDSETKYSGCADMDLCPKCVRKYRYMDDLADRCVEDYDKNIIKAGDLRCPPCHRSRASSAASAAAGRRRPSAPIPRAIGSWPSCATTDGISACSETGATWACARIATTSARGWTVMKMIDDVLDVMRCGEWMSTREIAAEVRRRQPQKHRTMCREYAAQAIGRLRAFGFDIEKDDDCRDDDGRRCVKYRLVSRWTMNPHA